MLEHSLPCRRPEPRPLFLSFKQARKFRCFLCHCAILPLLGALFLRLDGLKNMLATLNCQWLIPAVGGVRILTRLATRSKDPRQASRDLGGIVPVVLPCHSSSARMKAGGSSLYDNSQALYRDRNPSPDRRSGEGGAPLRQRLCGCNLAVSLARGANQAPARQRSAQIFPTARRMLLHTSHFTPFSRPFLLLFWDTRRRETGRFCFRVCCL